MSIPADSRAARTGKSGYQPACANEWVRGVCEKPRGQVRRVPAPSQVPARDGRDVIRWHLSGQDDQGRDFVMGVYPMLLDETCFFLAADFDKAHLAGGCCSRSGDMPPPGSAGRPGAIALGQRRARLVVLRGGRSGRVGPQTGCAHPHRDDGTPTGYRLGFLRPFLSQSGHAAARRLRQSDRAAAAETAAGSWQQRLRRRTVRSPPGPVGISVQRTQDRP